MRRQLQRLSPSDSDITAEFADSALYLGLARAKTGSSEAGANLALARSLATELHQSDPSNAIYFGLLAKVYLTPGQAMQALGQQDVARDFYLKSVELYGDLKKAGKASFESDAQMQEALQALRAVRAPKLAGR